MGRTVPKHPWPQTLSRIRHRRLQETATLPVILDWIPTGGCASFVSAAEWIAAPAIQSPRSHRIRLICVCSPWQRAPAAATGFVSISCGVFRGSSWVLGGPTAAYHDICCGPRGQRALSASITPEAWTCRYYLTDIHHTTSIAAKPMVKHSTVPRVQTTWLSRLTPPCSSVHSNIDIELQVFRLFMSRLNSMHACLPRPAGFQTVKTAHQPDSPFL